MRRVREVMRISAATSSMSGMRPDDIRTAIIYDHFTPYVLPQLEAFGFCKRAALMPTSAKYV